MAKYDWKVEPRDEDWSDETYEYFLVHINIKKMVEYLTKEFKKDWWFKADFGDDNCYIVAENNNFPVRLFFVFYEIGWAELKRHYTDGATYKDEIINDWNFVKDGLDYTFRKIKGMIEKYFDEFEESMKENKKSIKEYRTVGFEQLVRDTIVSILENPESYNSDLFDLGMCSEVIMTYDCKGRARIRNDGSVEIDYLTLPTYAWSSGYTPKNKKLAKLFDDMNESNMEMAKERLWDENKDELIELGITDKDNEKLNYNDLYDMGAGDLAEELSEYEMDLEGMDLYTDIYCQLEETDEGIELTITMTVDDEYGHALVKDYKSNTVLLQEDADDLEEFITDAIREVTEQF